MERVGKDARFSHITKDLRFRRMSKNTQKVKIDKRFKEMFTDKRFKLKYSVDKRGKPMSMTTNENLKKYYELSDSDEEEEEDNEDIEDESDNEEAGKKLENQTKLKNKETTKLKSVSDKKGVRSVSVKEESNLPEGKKKAQRKVKDGKKIQKQEVSNDSEEEEEGDMRKNSLKMASKKKSEKDGKMKKKKKKEIKVIEKEDSDEEEEKEESSEEEDNTDDEDSGLGDGPDLARGEGNVETSSSSEDDDSEEEEEDQEEFDHGWGELDKDVHTTEELGHRLAVCNMDWDRIKAQDIFVLLHSFVPTGGSIKSVKVYPSEFGLQRMKEEALSGPTELVQDKHENPPEEDVEREEGDYEEVQGTRYHREKLRRYQLNRLKYYYAVVETDSIGTASKIYEECDGMEYESSSTKLDLRFIPDDMEFTEEPKSVCTEMPAAYNPSLFVSTALAQSKVSLTWDETDQDRIKVTMMNSSQRKKTDDVNEEDFQAYLASSSEEEEDKDDDQPLADDDNDNEDENEESQIQKYRSLLQSLDDDKDQKKKKEVEMEVTWEPGLKETTEKIVKHKEKTKDQTPWDQYLMKKKERRQRKREERMNRKMTSDKEPEEQAAFSDDGLPAGVDEDPFFKQSLDSEEEDRKTKESKKTKKKKKRDKTLKSVSRDAEGELELLMMDEETDNRRHFNLKSIMKESNKKKKSSGDQKPEEDFQINVKDDRFTAIFDSHLYNIDPSAPEFKKTKSMEAIIEEKLKQRTSGKSKKTVSGQKRKTESDNINTGHTAKSGKLDSESISSLIHSVKSKTQFFQSKKRKK